jgi:hypothetical protein
MRLAHYAAALSLPGCCMYVMNKDVVEASALLRSR